MSIGYIFFYFYVQKLYIMQDKNTRIMLKTISLSQRKLSSFSYENLIMIFETNLSEDEIFQGVKLKVY